ncbi:cadaverine:lysine antiporter (APA family) [Luteibacter rhizovicinus]|uniref:Cadaverine:lysine antiporter (APA family) n=1 Tax=Luteibacter rhizovicinus TaxID=242606 RepID=A0A4R3YNU3_9GAMM|nr:amino acid permease [Luteibacter rhizovicinus]TCV94545.1 cadaverine:lysine antiporter (APA family) [Luteibacter rhizovicinus]
MTDRPVRKMGLLATTMLVAGNMIGTGVFLLPANLASVGSISIFGWVVATVGAMALGLVFARLGHLDPQQGGPYAYARDTFGYYIGFTSNYAYWFGNWIGNVAIALVVTGYLSELVPGLEGPMARAVFTLAVIWILSFANARGASWIGHLETWTLSLALVPILFIAIGGWYWFDRDLFLRGWNVSGQSDFSAVSSAASMALWAFMGVESAAVSAGVVDNPRRTIPLATLFGLAISAVVYVSCSTVIMGMLPMDTLRTSSAPFAEAGRLMIGPWGVVMVGVCAVLKSTGALGGWMLLVGQSAKAAADDGLFPSIFARMNRHGMPGAGLYVVAALMTAMLLLTMSPTLAGQFRTLTGIAVLLAILPYLFSAVTVIRFSLARHETGLRRIGSYAIGCVASIYCLWAILGASPVQVMQAVVFVLLSAPIYPFFMRHTEK